MMYTSEDDNRIAFFGIEGSFTYLAAKKYFGRGDGLVSCSTFRDVFKKIADGEVGHGVVPIQNTLAGSIYENYDLLTEYSLKVTGEVLLRIEHALMVHPSQKDIAVDDITEVFSHQKAIEQCGVFLRNHPSLHYTAFSDTATAAKHVASNGNGRSWAAIAHPDNARLQNLYILNENIEDNSQNYTRFLVVSKGVEYQGSGASKCSLVLYLPHQPGSLSRVFDLFAALGINLMKIESRPLPGKPFEYIFYLDIILPESCSPEKMKQKLSPYVDKSVLLGIYLQADRA